MMHTMRTNIVHAGADELTYEIRQIVAVAEKVGALGVPVIWENIGDPVAKGHLIPEWIKEIVARRVKDDRSYAYSPTIGLPEARVFIARERSRETGIPFTSEDVIFFNGTGDAISKIYTYLNRASRIIGPSPAYSTHSSAEAAHAGAHYLTYALDPKRNWLPDLNDLRNKVRYNPQIAGILIINPDNPTGVVYPKRVLEEIVSIARDYDLFLISDEIYAHLAYGSDPFVPLASVIGDVPGIGMRSLSKEFPWPGARCGWIEVYNRTRDSIFARYIQSVLDAKMLEVCSTTLPQSVLPEVLGDSRYAGYLAERRVLYAKRAEAAHKLLSTINGIYAPRPGGAFYLSVVFDDGVLPADGSLPIAKESVRAFIEKITDGVSPDKRFVYYLLGATGVCVVPLSSFNTTLQGFRMTLLEHDEALFQKTLETVAEAITRYISK